MELRHVAEADGRPPITAANMLFGSCWYGKVHPTLVECSVENFEKAKKCINPKWIVSKQSKDGRKGFDFCGSSWVSSLEIEDDTLRVINEGDSDPKLSGYCTPRWP